MKIFFLFLILLNIIFGVKGNCTDYKKYYLLGTLTSTNTTYNKCISNSNPCAYITLEIPGLATGMLSGCQEDVVDDITNILVKRRDIYDIFKKYINIGTKKIDMSLVCEKSINQTKSVTQKTLTGDMQFFVNCYPQTKLYLNPIVIFNPPSSNAIPVQCKRGSFEVTTCNEGYCGMLENAFLNQTTSKQINIKYQTCPNDLINAVYVLSYMSDVVNNKAFQNDKYKIGNICTYKGYETITSHNGILSYYMYVNCYDPSNGNKPQLPHFPDLSNSTAGNVEMTSSYVIETTSTSDDSKSSVTTQAIQTTTKGSSSNFYMTFSLSILLIFSLFFL